MKIRLFKPSIGEEELQAVGEVFRRAWLGQGPRLLEFERKWSEYIGCTDSVGLNSGTAALQLALAAFRFPRGNKVLVPAMTFVSSAVAAIHNNLEIVFVDSDPETLQLDPEDLERKWDPDCVAVMAVHFGGHPAPLKELKRFAEQKNLKIIEDCAHCAGGDYHGRKLGTWGDIGCFSFEEKKGMTTGDGGMVSCDDPHLLQPLRSIRWVGIDKDTWKRAEGYNAAGSEDARHWYYEIAEAGWKYNMNDLAAAIGLVQLAKLDRMNRRRREIIGRYLEGITGLHRIRPLLPYHLEGSAYWLFGVRCEQRDELILHLKRRGIPTSVHYMPLHLHPLFRDRDVDLPVVERTWETIVTLPLHVDLGDDEVDYILEALHDFE